MPISYASTSKKNEPSFAGCPMISVLTNAFFSMLNASSHRDDQKRTYFPSWSTLLKASPSLHILL